MKLLEKIKTKFKHSDDNNERTDEVFEKVLDYSVVPADEEFAKFANDIEVDKFGIEENDDLVPFWNPQTGKLFVVKYTPNNLGIGVPIMMRGNLSILLNRVKRDAHYDLLNELKLCFHQAQISRLQTIKDITDFPKAFAPRKVANLIARNYIISDELPFTTMQLIYRELLMNMNIRDYNLFIKMLRCTRVEFLKSMMPSINFDNPDFVSYATKFLSQIQQPHSVLARKVLIVANQFLNTTKNQLEMDSIEASLWFVSYERINGNNAWDDDNGFNLGLLNQMKQELSSKIYKIDDSFFENLKKAGYGPQLVWKYLHKDTDVFSKFDTSNVTKPEFQNPNLKQ